MTWSSMENPKDATKKLLELRSRFIKVAGYNFNIQNSVVFPYTNDDLSAKDILKPHLG